MGGVGKIERTMGLLGVFRADGVSGIGEPAGER